MIAVRAHRYGGSDVLIVEDAPRPVPGRREVLVRVHAAGVNPADWKMRAGYFKDFMPMRMPFVLGQDVAGVIEETGPGVTRLTHCDAVYGIADGSYAEYAVAREDALALKPRSLDFPAAASVPLAAMTAWQALFGVARLEEGQTVLIHGGAGGVGTFAVQLAKWKGAKVVATASQRNQSVLTSLGVDEPIDYQNARFEEIVRDVDVVIDTIGGDIQERSFGVLRPGGVLVALTAPPGQAEALRRGVTAIMSGTQPDSNQLREIGELIDAGFIEPFVKATFPLIEARRAQELSEAGHVRGKMVLLVR